MDAHLEPRYAEVADDGTLPGGDSPTLTYHVSPECGPVVQRGALVWVPLRKKAALGVVIDLHSRTPDFDVRPIYDVAPGDGLSDDQIEFGLWLQRETDSSLFGCLAILRFRPTARYPA